MSNDDYSESIMQRVKLKHARRKTPELGRLDREETLAIMRAARYTVSEKVVLVQWLIDLMEEGMQQHNLTWESFRRGDYVVEMSRSAGSEVSYDDEFTGTTPFDTQLIVVMRKLLQAEPLVKYIEAYDAPFQPVIRMAYSAYFMCLIILGLEEQLSVPQAQQGTEGLNAYLIGIEGYEHDVYSKLFNYTFDHFSEEMIPGMYTRIISLVSFVNVNMSMCGHEKIISQITPPDLFIELDAWLARNRSKIIDAASKTGRNALKNKWVV